MTENIQSIIDQISSKTKEVYNLLVQEREQNASLKASNSQLQTELDQKNTEMQKLAAKLNEQEEKMVSMTEQNSVPTAIPSLGRTQEIDDLVKEIEFCIGQLRK
jgi:flagellar biosynthesis/type III secretory pathway chaperone